MGETREDVPRGLVRRAATPLAILLVATSLLSSLAGPASADSGGPDAYGYTWVDSRFPNPGVGFSWIEGVSGGIDLALTDDGCSNNKVNFGFPFRFYGTIHSSAWVCANGFIAFNTPAGKPWLTDDFVSAMGADLDPSWPGSGHVYVKADTLSSPRRFIVTWDGTYTYATSDPQTFQIVLIENTTGSDGDVLLQYKDVTNPPLSLVGIENLGNTSSLFYTNPLEDGLAVMFLPPGSAPPADVLSVNGARLAPATVEPGQADVAMLRLNLTTPTNSVTLRRLRIDVTGLTSGPGDVSRIALWHDADRDGGYNATNDTFLVSAIPSGSPEQVALTLPSPMTIFAGPGEDLLIVFDVALSAVSGDWIGAGVLASTYVTVDPPDIVSSTNFPFDSYLDGIQTQIVEGVDTLTVTSWTATNPENVTQWQTDVSMLAVTMDADKGAVTVDRIRVRLVGVPPDIADVGLVKLFHDADGDGMLRPELDPLRSRGRFDASYLVTLAANVTVIAGSPETIWIALDIPPDATDNDTVGVRIDGTSDVTVVGTKDLVSPSNLPAETPVPSTVRNGTPPVIESRWAVRAPVPDGTRIAGEYAVGPGNARNLGAIGGNDVAAWLIVENDADHLYVAYDVPGDTTAGPNDTASLAFDTNETAFPLAPPDDAFVAGGPLGPFHAVFNATSQLWEIEDPCNETYDGNHTGLACVIGFDRSPLSDEPHRIYEFRIPLALLEVPLPIPAGTTVGFAAGSNWSEGVRDGDAGLNASWPLPEPTIPPAWFGVVEIAAAPPVNTAPELNWTGQPGYETDGVSPDAGTVDLSYVFRIEYRDADNDPPSLGDPRLYVLDGAFDIPGSPFTMREVDPADTNFVDGKVYERLVTFTACPRTYAYYMAALDERGAEATPTPTRSGPQVDCLPVAPTLANGAVTPDPGFVDVTFFDWTVEYRDANGDPPATISVSIRKGGTEVGNRSLGLRSWLGQLNNYTDGAVFGTTWNLSAPGGDYAFSFFASDGVLNVSTPAQPGPTVQPEPADTLLVSFFDEAPLEADRGARDVRMFSAVLTAASNVINVTSLQVDRVGASVDGDVAAVRLYHDIDMSGTVTAADVLLGQGPLSSGSVRLGPFALTVTAGTPAQVLTLIDVSASAAADSRVGLRVLDASSVEVSPPDLVAPFASFQSTRLLVNVPPSAVGLTVDGAPGGTPASLHVTSDAPTLGWAFSDANLNDVQQDAYNVSVFPEPAGTILWWRNATGPANAVPYGGPPLARGSTYRFDVRVSDGRLWGLPATETFRMNTAPSAPVLRSPTDQDTDLGPSTVVLGWDSLADPEGDVVSYRWSLATSPDFADEVTGTTVSTSVTVDTVGSTTYHWRVSAFDGYEWGPPSAARSFTTRPSSGGVLGRVVSAGVPVLAIVRLFDASGGVVAEDTTSLTGTFSFAGVPLGNYTLRVSAQGYVDRVIRDVDLTVETPVRDLGEIELEPVAEPPPQPPPPGPDWTTFLLWFAVAIALAVAASGSILSAIAVRRMRRPSEETRPEPEPSAEAAEAAPLPEAEEDESKDRARGEGVTLGYECPVCGVRVGEGTTICPGCGALFE